MNQKVVPDPQSVGKQMHEDPTHGHRTHVTPEEKAKALAANGSFDEGNKADPLPQGALSLEQIMALDPDKIPNDPKEIESLLGQTFGDKSLEKGPDGDMQVHRQQEAIDQGKLTPATEVTPPAAKADEGKTPTDDAKARAAADATAAAQPPAEADGTFVESRDGKGRIPYAVLKNERQQNAKLASELTKAQALIEQLQKGKAPGQAASTVTETEEHKEAADKAAAGALTAEDIAALEENFPPALVQALVKVNGLAAEARSLVGEIEQEAERVQAQELHETAQTVQDIIDRDPQLTEIQQDPAKWDEAVRIDDTLRSLSRWKDKSDIERFAEVKRMMGYEPSAAPTQRQPSAEELAAAKLAEAAKKQPQGRAFTHSDLPGGNPPPQSEREVLQTLDIHSLASRFDKMTPAQQEAFLARM